MKAIVANKMKKIKLALDNNRIPFIMPVIEEIIKESTNADKTTANINELFAILPLLIYLRPPTKDKTDAPIVLIIPHNKEKIQIMSIIQPILELNFLPNKGIK